MTAHLHAYEPAELIPPGETLLEWLESSDMTQTEFARRTNLTPKHINQVVKGGVGISPEVALAFDRVTGIPARYWLQLEVNFQAAKQLMTETENLSERLDLVDLFPYKELERLGRVKATPNKLERLRELLRFFGVATTAALEAVSLQPRMLRASNAFEPSDGALATWLRLAEGLAGDVRTKPFDAVACREAISDLRALTLLPGLDWLDPLRELTASVGIATVILKELPKCRVNGATRWLSPEKAMVALSFRHRRNDIFWFTFFHEMCHVLKHSKKETFIDAGNSDIAKELENEADAFAARTLIPANETHLLPTLTTPSEVCRFAARIGVAPGIVVGRLQHDGLVHPSQMTTLFDRYRFTDD